MLFTFLAVAAAWQSMALRPELGRVSAAGDISAVGDIIAKISSPKDSLVAIKAAADIVDGILAETENATDHISGDDAELLKSVIELVETTIYGSMDHSHTADKQSLEAAVNAVGHCNTDIAHRQSPDGDLGTLHQHTAEKQTELDMLQGVVDDSTRVNDSEWETFGLHMQMIQDAPVCPAFPARTMPALDVYFEKSEYSIWFAAHQASYNQARDVYTAADAALTAALEAYYTQRARRDTQYCDWKADLEAACAAFDRCFSEKSSLYNNEVLPRVTTDMNARIEVYKSGQNLVHQIEFLLGDVPTQEAPAPDTSRYVLDFPTLPEKGECDRDILTSPTWNPPIACFFLVGTGWCRTPSGARGAYTIVKEISLEDCKWRCWTDKACLAVEYHERKGRECELHTNYVDRIHFHDEGVCYAKNSKFRRLGDGWCRTPSGGPGTFAVVRGQSEGSCMAKCLADDTCLAFQFHHEVLADPTKPANEETENCELHTEVVDHIEPGDFELHAEAVCWAKDLLGDGLVG